MAESCKWLALIACTVVIPPLVVGLIRKAKAWLQNRIGPPVLQPAFDLIRLVSKSETVSRDTCWIFRGAACANLAIMLLLSAFIPWLSFQPATGGCSDMFLVIYLLGLSRFLSVLAALDAGSAFGGFGASREVTLALLVEPALVLCLASLGVSSTTSDLERVFSAGNKLLDGQWSLWFLSGCGIFLSALVELSRMPADDPTTHLELTMVHEAMILENSGPNLALVEAAHMLKISLFLGLSAQCFLHGLPALSSLPEEVRAVIGIVSVLALALVIVVIESSAVKLRWTKLPEFVAYPVAMGFLCVLAALAR